MKREFELKDGSSNKFWTIEVAGTSQIVRFGRIGTKGQAKTKEFASEEEALAASEKLIAQKVSKGYTEVAAAVEAAGPAEGASRVLKVLVGSEAAGVKSVVYATAILSELGDGTYAKSEGEYGSEDEQELDDAGEDEDDGETAKDLAELEAGLNELQAGLNDLLGADLAGMLADDDDDDDDEDEDEEEEEEDGNDRDDDEEDDWAYDPESCKLHLPEGCKAVTAEHEAMVAKLEGQWSQLAPRIMEQLWEEYEENFLEEMEAMDDAEYYPVARSQEELGKQFYCDSLVLGADGQSVGILGHCAWDEEHGLGILVELSAEPSVEVGSQDLIIQGAGDNFSMAELALFDQVFERHAEKAKGEPTVTARDFFGSWTSKPVTMPFTPVRVTTQWTISERILKEENVLTMRGREEPFTDGQEMADAVREWCRDVKSMKTEREIGHVLAMVPRELGDAVDHPIEFRGFVDDRAYVCKLDEDGQEIEGESLILRRKGGGKLQQLDEDLDVTETFQSDDSKPGPS